MRSLVDVGAAFYSAAELEQLALPGLPKRREHIARRASDENWPHRARAGRGGGREFALNGLPALARNEILKRRVTVEAARAIGLPAVSTTAPIAIAQDLTAKQAETSAARQAVLASLDRFVGPRRTRAAVEAFVAAYVRRQLALPDWVTAIVPAVSRPTLYRWLEAREATAVHGLTDNRVHNGAKSIFERAPELGEWVLGAHLKQPALSMDNLLELVKERFKGGVAGEDGLVIGYPSVRAIGRFLAKWNSTAKNAALVAAVNDPDRYRSKFRFAFGNASAQFVRPNQRWEIDASPADRLFADGRSNIYAIIDVFSRRGLAMVSKTPRTLGALLLIARAVQAWGVPEEISTDNGSDFTSKHFDLCLHQLGIRHHVVPPYSPQLKPFVERFIGTIQHKFMPLFEGYAGHNVAARARIEQRISFAERMGEGEKELLGELLGYDVGLKLMAEFGGMRLDIPKRPLTKWAVWQKLGAEAAKALCRLYGSSRIKIPVASRMARLARNASIATDPRSHNEVARAHGVSRRWVKMVKADQRAPQAGNKERPPLLALLDDKG